MFRFFFISYFFGLSLDKGVFFFFRVIVFNLVSRASILLRFLCMVVSEIFDGLGRYVMDRGDRSRWLRNFGKRLSLRIGFGFCWFFF